MSDSAERVSSALVSKFGNQGTWTVRVIGFHSKLSGKIQLALETELAQNLKINASTQAVTFAAFSFNEVSEQQDLSQSLADDLQARIQVIEKGVSIECQKAQTEQLFLVEVSPFDSEIQALSCVNRKLEWLI